MIDGESAPRRLVTRITVTYRLADDPKAGEQTRTLVHSGEGAEVDGVIWSDELMRKLAYLEGEECVAPKKLAGQDEWRLEGSTTESDGGGPCYWVHGTECTWMEYCPQA